MNTMVSWGWVICVVIVAKIAVDGQYTLYLQIVGWILV